jgi:uncharacterized membrane protein
VQFFTKIWFCGIFKTCAVNSLGPAGGPRMRRVKLTWNSFMGEKIAINFMLFLLASCQPTSNPLLLVKRGQKTSHAKLVANSTSSRKISHAEFVTKFTTFGFLFVAHVILFLSPPTTIHMVVYICTSVWQLFEVSSSDQALTFLCCVHITSLTIPRYLCWVSLFYSSFTVRATHW